MKSMAELKVFATVADIGLDQVVHYATVQRWVDRGDGVAVYENQDLGSREIGHRIFFSYGSNAAQFPGMKLHRRCPDVGRPMWQYQLVGIIPPIDQPVEMTEVVP